MSVNVPLRQITGVLAVSRVWMSVEVPVVASTVLSGVQSASVAADAGLAATSENPTTTPKEARPDATRTARERVNEVPASGMATV